MVTRFWRARRLVVLLLALVGTGLGLRLSGVTQAPPPRALIPAPLPTVTPTAPPVLIAVLPPTRVPAIPPPAYARAPHPTPWMRPTAAPFMSPTPRPTPRPTPWTLPELIEQADVIALIQPGPLIGNATGFGGWVQRLTVETWLKRPPVLTTTLLTLWWGPIEEYSQAPQNFRSPAPVIVFLAQGWYLSESYGNAYSLHGAYPVRADGTIEAQNPAYDGWPVAKVEAAIRAVVSPGPAATPPHSLDPHTIFGQTYSRVPHDPISTGRAPKVQQKYPIKIDLRGAIPTQRLCC